MADGTDAAVLALHGPSTGLVNLGGDMNQRQKEPRTRCSTAGASTDVGCCLSGRSSDESGSDSDSDANSDGDDELVPATSSSCGVLSHHELVPATSSSCGVAG